MKPVVLTTPRLLLDLPVAADRGLITEYCRDPLFEHFMTLPWPYHPENADYFIGDLVPTGWASGAEYTWALRSGGLFLGAIGFRGPTASLGYWIGAPHRGQGYMTEAVGAVTRWLFTTGVEVIGWECVVGNLASASVARKAGFTYTGERPSELTFRDGSHPLCWHGVLRPHDSPTPKPGWPPKMKEKPADDAPNG